MREEPQPLVRRRQRNGLADPAKWDLTGRGTDGEPVAGSLADHVLKPPGAVRVAVCFDPGYSGLDPRFHAEG